MLGNILRGVMEVTMMFFFFLCICKVKETQRHYFYAYYFLYFKVFGVKIRVSLMLENIVILTFTIIVYCFVLHSIRPHTYETWFLICFLIHIFFGCNLNTCMNIYFCAIVSQFHVMCNDTQFLKQKYPFLTRLYAARCNASQGTLLCLSCFVQLKTSTFLCCS